MDEIRYAIVRLTVSKEDVMETVTVAQADSLRDARAELAKHHGSGTWQEHTEYEIHLLRNDRDLGSLALIQAMHGQWIPADEPDLSSCPICSELGAVETAFQKFGSDYPDTSLPEAARLLEPFFDFKPGSERARQLLRCPRCGTFYLYESDYEYLAFGSEDEQRLTRLDPLAAAVYCAEASERRETAIS